MEVHNFVTDRPLRIVVLGSKEKDSSENAYHFGARLGTPGESPYDAELARQFGLHTPRNENSSIGSDDVLKMAEVRVHCKKEKNSIKITEIINNNNNIFLLF